MQVLASLRSEAADQPNGRNHHQDVGHAEGHEQTDVKALVVAAGVGPNRHPPITQAQCHVHQDVDAEHAEEEALARREKVCLPDLHAHKPAGCRLLLDEAVAVALCRVRLHRGARRGGDALPDPGLLLLREVEVLLRIHRPRLKFDFSHKLLEGGIPAQLVKGPDLYDATALDEYDLVEIRKQRQLVQHHNSARALPNPLRGPIGLIPNAPHSQGLQHGAPDCRIHGREGVVQH
mmetsp:Transcript_93409/g.302390  ORF Transcript_93409/g.302390 Transcript_93409/m.302390 type:complete len:234 (+) Transcript_93409:1802-2503(+)